MVIFIQLVVGLVLLLLSACTTVSQQEPVPVEERSIESRGIPEKSVTVDERVNPGQPMNTGPERKTEARVSSSPVVLAMLDEANEKQQAGNHAAAIFALERALAREPKNAYLWHRLATLHLEQKDWQQAYVLANKSNSLIRDNPSLKIDNWKIILDTKRQLGDVNGTRRAEREIQRLKGGE